MKFQKLCGLDTQRMPILCLSYTHTYKINAQGPSTLYILPDQFPRIFYILNSPSTIPLLMIFLSVLSTSLSLHSSSSCLSSSPPLPAYYSCSSSPPPSPPFLFSLPDLSTSLTPYSSSSCPSSLLPHPHHTFDPMMHWEDCVAPPLGLLK